MAAGEIAFVDCAACGARMKADREWCLRCGAPLAGAAPPAPAATPRERALVTGVVAGLFLLVGATIVWQARTPPVDPQARPVAVRPARPAPAVPAAAPAAREATAAGGAAEPFAPATVLESRRLGDLAFGAGDYDRARAQYEEAVRRAPGSADALNNLGQVLVRQQRTGEAIDLFTRAIRIAPDKWAVHFNLAHAYGELERWDAAVAEYRTAARLFPDDYATRYNLAMGLQKRGDDAGAVEEFAKAIALAPGEPTFHLSLAVTLEQLNRKAEARAEYGRYLEMAPAAPDATRVKARIAALSRSAGSGGGAATP